MFSKPAVQILFLSFATTVALVAGNLVFADQDRDIPELSRRLRKYDVLEINPKSAALQVRRTGKLLLKTTERVFDLQLVPNDLRSSDYRSQVIEANGVARSMPRDPVNTYKGFVKDMNGAEVRMTVTDESIEGSIITSKGRYFIQPARSLSKAAGKDELIFYNTQDLRQDAETSYAMLADQVAVEQDRAKNYVNRAASGEIGPAQTNPLNPRKLVRLATDADAEYVAALGGASQANNHILSIMNQVDGIYQFELGITFQVVFQNAWTNAATDPYSSMDNSGVILSEFRIHWDANFKNIQRDLAHFWTGKSLVTPGSAYLGVVCRDRGSAYGFSGRMPEDPANPITESTVGLTAHEIGHNFGGVHPQSPNLSPEVGTECGRTIMQATFADTFCFYSRSQIMGFTIASGSCLTDLATPPPSHPTCVDVPIDPGVVVNGALATTDCRSPSQGVDYFADRYVFDGQAGERLNITMTSGSPGLEPFFYLIGPDQRVLDVEVGRIPPSGSLALPLTGRYVIETTSSQRQQIGNYSLKLSLDGCVLSVDPTAHHFAAAGGSGTINVTATGSNCGPYQFNMWPIMTAWLKPQTGNGSGSQSLGFTVDPHTQVAGRRAFLIVGAAFGSQKGGLWIPITQSGTGPDCSLTPIAFGETVNGTLSTTDCRSPIRGGASDFADRYAFTAKAGQEVAILASPTPIITSLVTLIGPTGRVILQDENGGPSFFSRIPGGNGMLKLGLPGQYVIEVTAGTGGFTGAYSVTLLNNEPPTLFAEESSDIAIALESVSMLRGPFSLTTPFNLSDDQQTRLMLIAENLALLPGEGQSAVTAIAEDSQLNTYPLTVELVTKIPGFGRLTQIVVKLPSNLPSAEDLRIKITLRERTSNKVRFRIE